MNTAIAAVKELQCLPVPEFNVENWDEITAVFASLPAKQYAQAWRKLQQSRFRPGRTHVGYDRQNFWVFSEFEDFDIFNTCVKLNQHVYRLGDTFEIFLRPLSGEEYIEFHVTPDNQHMQIRWPQARRWTIDRAWIPTFLAQRSFRSWTQVDKENNRWRVLAAIPYETLKTPPPREGDAWLYSFGRYDYTRGHKRPVVSSTTLHLVPDFHRQHEWNRLVFCAGF